jgi:hypothetical protein
MNRLKPIVGQWYLRHDKGQTFQVVSVDDADGTVELQDFDGNLDEVDIKAWFAQDIEAIDPPEDLTGVLDVAEPDEADGSDEAEPEGKWTGPEPMRAAEVDAGQNTAAEDESDDWAEGAPEEPFIADEPDAARRSPES